MTEHVVQIRFNARFEVGWVVRVWVTCVSSAKLEHGS